MKEWKRCGKTVCAAASLNKAEGVYHLSVPMVGEVHSVMFRTAARGHVSASRWTCVLLHHFYMWCLLLSTDCSDNGICTVPVGGRADESPYCVCEPQWIGKGCHIVRPRRISGDPHLETLDG